LVCVIDEMFARTQLPGESALGKRVTFSSSRDPELKWMEIVGIVAHTKNYGVDQPSRVELYMPYLQNPAGAGVTATLRTGGGPGSLAGALRQALREVDPEIPVYQARSLPELVADENAPR